MAWSERQTRLLCCLLVASLIVVVGCSRRGGAGNIPKTAPVSGIVTLDGKPVDGASVVFVPAQSPGWGAYAITDSSGRFVLKSSEEVSGAVPGKYFVQVTKLVSGSGETQFLVKEDIEHALAAGGKTSDGGSDVKNVLPEKYSNAKTSGIEVTVPETGLENLEIRLSSSE